VSLDIAEQNMSLKNTLSHITNWAETKTNPPDDSVSCSSTTYFEV